MVGSITSLAQSNDVLAGTDWSLTKVICKSGKADLPDGYDLVWDQSFQDKNNYRLYETLNNRGSRYCDNILYGSYEIKANNQVAITTSSSPDTKMCEVNPYGTFLWNYDISKDGKNLVLTGAQENEGNCPPGDPVEFHFRRI
jgi:hypothetical protein